MLGLIGLTVLSILSSSQNGIFRGTVVSWRKVSLQCQEVMGPLSSVTSCVILSKWLKVLEFRFSHL